MPRPTRFSPEVRVRAVRMVMEHGAAHDSQWAAITSIAEKIGCTAEALRKWVRQAERDAGTRPGLATEARERLKQLSRRLLEPLGYVPPGEFEQAYYNRQTAVADLAVLT